MDVKVNGKQIDIGQALQSYVKDKLASGVFKYFDRPVDATVTFSKDGHEYRADCSVHLSTGIFLQSHDKATDVYACFDGAVSRLEKRLRRYKRRLKDHHSDHKEPAPASPAPYYVIASGADEDDEPGDLSPLIIAEETAMVRRFTVGEAVMQMDLTETPVVVFKDSKSGRVNIVYRRADGNIGWIDPQEQ